MIILVGGGSRSGKSRQALSCASRPFAIGGKYFIATAETLDQEMQARADGHRAERGRDFTNIEEPLDLAGAISRVPTNAQSIVVDCLTLWVSNLMLAGLDVRQAADAALAAAKAHPATVVLVTNEVGCGIVPDSELVRRFRDETGWLNQQAAASASQIWWMIFGCPLQVK